MTCIPTDRDSIAVAGPLYYVELADPLAVSEIGHTWSTECRLLPAAELFREHAIGRATARLLLAVAKGG
jgi:hypothetical protein